MKTFTLVNVICLPSATEKLSLISNFCALFCYSEEEGMQFQLWVSSVRDDIHFFPSIVMATYARNLYLLVALDTTCRSAVSQPSIIKENYSF